MKRTIIVLFLLFLFSCNFNIIKNNEVKEKDKANEVIDVFYQNIQNDNIEEFKDLFSDEFTEQVQIEDFQRALSSYNKILGNYIDRELYEWATKRSELDNIWEVSLIYIVNYSEHKSIEKFNLLKERGVIKISNYTINSKALENID